MVICIQCSVLLYSSCDQLNIVPMFDRINCLWLNFHAMSYVRINSNRIQMYKWNNFKLMRSKQTIGVFIWNCIGVLYRYGYLIHRIFFFILFKIPQILTEFKVSSPTVQVWVLAPQQGSSTPNNCRSILLPTFWLVSKIPRVWSIAGLQRYKNTRNRISSSSEVIIPIKIIVHCLRFLCAPRNSDFVPRSAKNSDYDFFLSKHSRCWV